MEQTPGTPGPAKCCECNGQALRKVEPDGARRCFGHSRDPLNIERRARCGDNGRLIAEKGRGIPVDKRKAVLAGVVPIEKARAEQAKANAAPKRVEPIPLESKANVLSFLGRAAGELMNGGADPAFAQAVSALARAALAALGADLPEAGEEDEAPRGFAFETTAGASVELRGRDEPTGSTGVN